MYERLHPLVPAAPLSFHSAVVSFLTSTHEADGININIRIMNIVGDYIFALSKLANAEVTTHDRDSLDNDHH